MNSVVILFGTESGNAELAAEDIAADISETDADCSVAVVDMTDFDVSEFTAETFYLVVCSTHGDGELPSGAKPLLIALEEHAPDLAGVRYAMFGLGDRSYETYSQGSEIIDRKLAELGAERVGVYGRHDANDGTLPNDDAVAWSRELLTEAIAA